MTRPPGPEADSAIAVTAPRRQLVAVWLTAALVLGALLVVANASRSGGDDPDPARQRPGFLDAAPLPVPAPRTIEGLPQPRRRAVVFFASADKSADLCRAVAGRGSLHRVDTAVVIEATAAPPCPGTSPVADPVGVIARSYGMRSPRDGEPPTGYAVIDSAGQIRYRTLDPGIADRLDELSTILRATP